MSEARGGSAGGTDLSSHLLETESSHSQFLIEARFILCATSNLLKLSAEFLSLTLPWFILVPSSHGYNFILLLFSAYLYYNSNMITALRNRV